MLFALYCISGLILACAVLFLLRARLIWWLLVGLVILAVLFGPIVIVAIVVIGIGKLLIARRGLPRLAGSGIRSRGRAVGPRGLVEDAGNDDRIW